MGKGKYEKEMRRKSMRNEKLGLKEAGKRIVMMSTEPDEVIESPLKKVDFGAPEAEAPKRYG